MEFIMFVILVTVVLACMGYAKMYEKKNHVNIIESFEDIPIWFYCDKKYIDWFHGALCGLPHEFRELLAIKGMKLYCIDRKQFELLEARDKGAVGLFDANQKKLYCVTDSYNLGGTFRHEMGHFCDYVRGNWKSFSRKDENIEKEMKAIKDSGRYKIPEYYMSMNEEFAACCISNYLKPESLYKVTPEMVQIGKTYVDAVIEAGKQLHMN